MGTLGKGGQHSSGEKRADSAHGESARASEQELRRVLETVGGEPCLLEDVTFDVVWNGLRVSSQFLGLAVLIRVIRPQTFECHVWPPNVVPVLELGAQKGEMVESLDQRDTFEPLVLEGLDHSLRHSDRTVLPTARLG